MVHLTKTGFWLSFGGFAFPTKSKANRKLNSLRLDGCSPNISRLTYEDVTSNVFVL